jgi:hypothetical protein
VLKVRVLLCGMTTSIFSRTTISMDSLGSNYPFKKFEDASISMLQDSGTQDGASSM